MRLLWLRVCLMAVRSQCAHGHQGFSRTHGVLAGKVFVSPGTSGAHAPASESQIVRRHTLTLARRVSFVKSGRKLDRVRRPRMLRSISVSASSVCSLASDTRISTVLLQTADQRFQCVSQTHARRSVLVRICARPSSPVREERALQCCANDSKKNDGPVSRMLSFPPRRLCVSVRCAGTRVKTARRCSCEVRVLEQAAGVDGELSECGRSTHCLQTRVVFLSNFFSGIRAVRGRLLAFLAPLSKARAISVFPFF